MSRGNDSQRPASQGRLRVTLEFSRSDDPPLFDALIELPKGRRRVARLRTLAHDGLLASAASVLPANALRDGAAAKVPAANAMREQELLTWPDATLTAGVFDPPLNE